MSAGQYRHTAAGEPSWLPQMPHNGLNLRCKEGVPAWLVLQLMKLLHQRSTAVYPSLEGLERTLARNVRIVEQSQVRLRISTDSEHVYRDLRYPQR